MHKLTLKFETESGEKFFVCTVTDENGSDHLNVFEPNDRADIGTLVWLAWQNIEKQGHLDKQVCCTYHAAKPKQDTSSEPTYCMRACKELDNR